MTIDRRIYCDGHDITDDVAEMYDAIANSLDWGSGFLSGEQVAAIKVVGIVAGWDEHPTPNMTAPDKFDANGLRLARTATDHERERELVDERIAEARAAMVDPDDPNDMFVHCEAMMLKYNALADEYRRRMGALPAR